MFLLILLYIKVQQEFQYNQGEFAEKRGNLILFNEKFMIFTSIKAGRAEEVRIILGIAGNLNLWKRFSSIGWLGEGG